MNGVVAVPTAGIRETTMTTDLATNSLTLHNRKAVLAPFDTDKTDDMNAEPIVDEEIPNTFFVQAEYDFTSTDGSALSFNKGDVIEVLTQLDSGWWDGLIDGKRGWMPCNYVKRISDQEAEDWFIAKETEERERELTYRSSRRGIHQTEKTPFSDHQDLGTAWLERQADSNGLSSLNIYDAVGEDELEGGGLDALANELLKEGDGTDMSASRGGFGSSVDYQGHLGQHRNGSSPDGGGGDADDFWVPSLTDDGQIYYHNTKTGEDTWEVPSLPEPSPSISSNGSASRGISRPTSTDPPNIPPRFGSSSSYAQLYNPREAVSSPTSGGFGLPRIDPRTGQLKEMGPWLARLTDDGVGYVYVNKETGETRKELPLAYSTGSPAVRVINFSGGEEVKRLSAAQSDASEPDSPGMMSSLQNFASQQVANEIMIDPLPRLMAWEKQTMEALRIQADTRQDRRSTSTVDSGREELDRLVEIVTECVEEIVVKSESYSALCGPNVLTQPRQDDPEVKQSAKDLKEAVARTTPAVRNFLYASRCSLFGMSDLIAAAIPNLITDDSRTLKIKERQRAHALSYASPELMHTPQRRLVAALSKIVFFAHAAVGMDWPLVGGAERLGQDARDLEKALRAYISEVYRIGCLAGTIRGGDRYAHRPRGLRDKDGQVIVDPMTSGANTKSSSGISSRSSRVWKPLDLAGITVVKAKADNVFRSVQNLQDQATTHSDEDSTPFRQLFLHINALQTEIASIDLAGSLDLDPAGYSFAAIAELVDDYNTLTIKAARLFKQFENNLQTLSVCSSSLYLLLSTSGDAQELDQVIKTLLTTLDAVVAALIQFEDISRGQEELLATGVKGHVGSRSSRAVDLETLSLSKRRQSSRRESEDSRMSSLRSSNSVHPRDGKARGPNEGSEVTMTASPKMEAGGSPLTSGIQPSPSQNSLSSLRGLPPLIRPRQSSNASGSGSRMSPSSSIHSLAQTLDEGRDLSSTFRSSTSGLIKAMPFLRNLGSSDGDKGAKPSPNKSSKQKLAKLLGEESVLETEREPIRPPPEKPFYLGADYADNDIIMNADGTVKAGTLPALVERLTTHEQLDFTFTSTFLITYRSFATGPEVVDLLCERYAIIPPPDLTPEQHNDWKLRKQTPVKLRVYNVFKNWVDQYFIEGADADILDRIRTFASEVMANDTIKMPSEQLIRAVNRRQLDGETVFRSPTTSFANAPTPMLPRMSSRRLQLLDIDARELARQLTILESNLYNKIRPVDCLNKAWSQTDRPESGENIKAMILTSNRIAGWVAEAVLSHTDVKRRATTMKHFVQIAKYCKALNNFSTMAAVMAGLNSTPIRRLKRTREQLGSKTLGLMDELDKALDSGKNFAGYRETLKLITPPCIPFLGVYLTFLTFIEDGNSNLIPAPFTNGKEMPSIPTFPSSSSLASTASSVNIQSMTPPPSGPSTAATNPSNPSTPTKMLIHFFKRQKSADVIREIQGYQNTPYNLMEVKSVVDWVKGKLEEVEKGGVDMYDLSCQLEPKEREEEKLTRMLRESGML